MEIQDYLEKGLNFMLTHMQGIIWAILILIIGMWLVKKIVKITQKIMGSKGLDTTLQKFLGNLLSWILKVLVIIRRSKIDTNVYVLL